MGSSRRGPAGASALVKLVLVPVMAPCTEETVGNNYFRFTCIEVGSQLPGTCSPEATSLALLIN